MLGQESNEGERIIARLADTLKLSLLLDHHYPPIYRRSGASILLLLVCGMVV